jgi:hypothetical protein
MKNLQYPVLGALVLALSLSPLTGAAQQQGLQLPRPSPEAKVTQTVGLTDMTVEYSSPGVKGRKIWGSLVPYDQVWRTGANAPTKVTFSRDVTIEGKPVPAGTYSLFTIPTKKNWTIILNKNPNANTNDYKQDQDLLRAQVKPGTTGHHERLAFNFTDFTDEGTNLNMEWEKVRVSLPIKVNTAEQATTAIQKMSEGSWQPWNQAARYMLETRKDFDMGLKLADQSLALKEHWFNTWTKAQLLAAKGDFKSAYPVAEKANELGKKSEMFFFADEVKKALAEWKPKTTK